MADNLKHKVLNILERRNLCSYMNNTKWNELINSMLNDMPFPPPYDIKYIDIDHSTGDDVNKGIYHYGDWYETFLLTENVLIEWVKIKPVILKHRGLLIPPEVIDETQELITILEKYNIPYTEKNNIFIVYGYK
ncbi:MAG: hypothetical protein NC177_04765 [Ruminococcus flavefaciens]|nr:hypothetical protein [Ruminococcus flavefaciens]